MSDVFRPRFPDYDVLQKSDLPSWNEQTRAVIKKRLAEVPERRFLTGTEWAILRAVCARLIPQPDRSDPVPIAPFIDDKLAKNRGDRLPLRGYAGDARSVAAGPQGDRSGQSSGRSPSWARRSIAISVCSASFRSAISGRACWSIRAGSPRRGPIFCKD